MHLMKRSLAMLLVLMMVVSCLPAGAIVASAEESAASGALELNARYESGMIFQHGKPWQIHGTGTAGATVTAVLEGTVTQTKSAVVADDGNWSINMDAVAGGYDTYTVTVTSGEKFKILENVVFGEVWVTGGQSNMHYDVWQITTEEQQNILQNSLAESDAASYIRFYNQDAEHGLRGVQSSPVGGWGNASVWEDVYNCSATGIYFAIELQAKLDMPVGFVVAAVGGTGITSWVDPTVAPTYTDYYALVQSKNYDTDTDNTRDYLGGWFNSKVAPWAGYEVSGMLWYQGEHERDGNETLQTLGIEALLESWSKVFDSEGTASATELPLIAIQIAPYATATSDYSLTNNYKLNAAMRAGVDKVTAKGGKAAAMALYDFYVTVNDIHPKNKPEVGARAADMAMGLVYGAEGIHVSPAANEAEFGDDVIIITFDNADNGLKYVQLNETDNYRVLNANHGLDTTDFYADKLNGFTVWTGSKLVAADAAIVDGAVQVTVPANTNAAGVYYGYGPEILSANLFNAEGYPAMPFYFGNDSYEATAHQSALWDIENDPNTVDIDGTYVNDSRNHSYLSEDTTNGVLGSTALKFELKSNPGHDITNTINFEPQGYGLDGNVTISAMDDIFWFWVDLDYSADQYIQLSVNDTTLANDSSAVIYTIEEDGNGAPAMVQIPYGGSDSVAGVDLKSHSSTGNMAIIKLYDGFTGWLGVPVSLYSGGTAGKALAEGDSITSFGLLVRQKTDGVLANQQVGDCLYLDEFWLTSAGQMPGLSDKELLYTGVEGAKQVSVWNAEHDDLTDGYDMSASSSGSYDTVAPVISTGNGVSESNALAYVRTTNSNNQSNNFTLKSSVKGFDSVEIASTDVLWFWVDSELTSDRLLHIQLNGSHLNDDYIYTIVNKGGNAAIKRLDYDETGKTSGNGLALVASGGNGGTTDETAYARIRLETGWSGWIGIPVANFCGNNSTVPSGSVTSIVFRLAGGKGTENETVYFDEFWITEADKMPKLSNEKLLYRGDPAFQTSLWDIEENTITVDIDGAYTNDTRNHSYLSEEDTAGVLGSTTLKYELKSNPGHDMTNTINFNPTTYGLDGTVTITSMDDIFWYWVDLDYSEDQYIQLSVNNKNLAIDTDAVIYTIQADANGAPAMIEVKYGGSDNVSGIDLLSHSVSGNLSIIKLFDGFSGWLGIPVSMYSGGTTHLAEGETITKFGLLVRQKTDGDLNNQQAGDCLYLDEFWLTSKGKMPDLSDEALLYIGDEIEDAGDTYQTSLLDFEDLTAGDSVGTMQGAASSYADAASTVSGNSGVSDSQALAYTIGGVNNNQNKNVQLDSQLEDHTVYAETDILWFWVDSDLSNERLLHVQVNGNLLQQESIYTIINNNGVPTIQSVDYVDDRATVNALAPVNSNWSGGGTYARIKMPTGWYGWIGVPMSAFDISSGSVAKIQLRVYGERNLAPIQASEVLHIDEFWLTSANTMPALDDDKLLYTQNIYTVTYIAENSTVAEYSVEYGENVTDIPNVPEKNGYIGIWNHDGKAIAANTTITADYDRFSIDEWNLVLGDEIGVNFYASIPESCIANTTATITVNGVTSAVEGVADGDYYVFTVGVAAAQMMDSIEFKLVYANQVVTKTCTIREYADEILNGDYTVATKTLVKQMLNYGAAAQTYFGHNADNLANAGITVENVELTGVTAPEMGVSGSVDGIRYYGATLLFTSKTAVRIYFDGSIENCTFQVGERTLTPVAKDGLYYVEIADIAPQKLDASLEVKVICGEQTMTVTYSPMNYMVRMAVKGSDNLKALLKAMYNYHLAAVECTK